MPKKLTPARRKILINLSAEDGGIGETKFHGRQIGALKDMKADGLVRQNNYSTWFLTHEGRRAIVTRVYG